MEQRILFAKGLQKEFFNRVKYNLRAPSLRSILQFGFDVPYSTLKGYYAENFFLPKNLFDNLCRIAKIKPQNVHFKQVNDNWGQVKGGKMGIKTLRKKYPRELRMWRRLGMLNSPIIPKAN